MVIMLAEFRPTRSWCGCDVIGTSEQCLVAL